MRLVTYSNGGDAALGVLINGDRVVDAGTAAAASAIDSSTARPDDAVPFLEMSAEDRIRLVDAAAGIEGRPLSEVLLLPPVLRPSKILCIGLNYESHAEEARRHGLPVPDRPIVFAKFPTSLLGSGESVVLPASNPDRVDYEGELALVIGRGGKHIAASDAYEHVAGYMPFNDISARDLQLASPQWTMGKAHDASAPCGPALVTADEVPDPSALRLRTIHNGEVVQDASTDELLFDIPALIAWISALITLEPGDIIATGTPAGVGHARDPQRYLADGDTIEVEIDGLGRLSNRVELERAPSGADLVGVEG